MKMENFYHGSMCASVEYVGLYFNIFGLYLLSIFIKNGLYFGLYRDQNQIETKLSNTATMQWIEVWFSQSTISFKESAGNCACQSCGDLCKDAMNY